MKTLVIGGAVLVAVTTAAVAAHATSKGRNGPLASQAQVGERDYSSSLSDQTGAGHGS